jgi:hypothetical protein
MIYIIYIYGYARTMKNVTCRMCVTHRKFRESGSLPVHLWESMGIWWVCVSRAMYVFKSTLCRMKNVPKYVHLGYAGWSNMFACYTKLVWCQRGGINFFSVLRGESLILCHPPPSTVQYHYQGNTTRTSVPLLVFDLLALNYLTVLFVLLQKKGTFSRIT